MATSSFYGRLPRWSGGQRERHSGAPSLAAELAWSCKPTKRRVQAPHRYVNKLNLKADGQDAKGRSAYLGSLHRLAGLGSVNVPFARSQLYKMPCAWECIGRPNTAFSCLYCASVILDPGSECIARQTLWKVKPQGFSIKVLE